MNPKLKALLDQINAKKTEITALADQDKLDEMKAAKEELDVLQAKFEMLSDVLDETPKPADPKDHKDRIPAGDPKDATKEFADAARAGFKVSNALTTGVREGSNTDGGYTVPEDIQTMINDYKRAEFSLESLIGVETVSTNKGSRTYETKADMTGFADIDEGGELGEMDTPEFERVSYAIGDRGGWLPITNDLLSDTDQNITARITNWIARKSNATSNNKVKGLIATKTPTEIETLDEIMKGVIVTLGGAYRDSAQVLTNDDGLLFFSTLKDTTGRALLYPDPANPMQMIICIGPLRVPIVAVPNKVVTSVTNVAGKRKIPIIAADFKEAFKKFDRQQTSLLSSNIAVAGTLNAFTQNLTLVRAIERNDYKIADTDAFVNQLIVTDDANVTGN